jgi:hypothetical protein
MSREVFDQVVGEDAADLGVAGTEFEDAAAAVDDEGGLVFREESLKVEAIVAQRLGQNGRSQQLMSKVGAKGSVNQALEGRLGALAGGGAEVKSQKLLVARSDPRVVGGPVEPQKIKGVRGMGEGIGLDLDEAGADQATRQRTHGAVSERGPAEEVGLGLVPCPQGGEKGEQGRGCHGLKRAQNVRGHTQRGVGGESDSSRGGKADRAP